MNILRNYNIPALIKIIKMMGKRSKLFIFCILIFCAVEMAVTVFSTFGTKGVITALGQKNLALFWESILFIFLSSVIWWLYAPISTYLCDTASKSTIRDIKTNLSEHIISLPMKYLDSKSNGELLSAVANDTNCLQQIYDWSLFQVIRSALGGAWGIVVMMVIDWHFAIIVILFGTLSVITTSYFSKKLEQAGENLQSQLAKTSTDAYEFVKAAKTIRLLNLVSVKTQDFHKSTGLEADTKMKSGRISSKMNAIITGISSISYIAILITGAFFVYFKLSDWGTVISLAQLKYITDMLFLECGQFMAEMQTNIAGVKRLFEISNTPKEKILRDMSFTIDKIKNPLTINNVSFSYDENTPVIENFNMLLENNKLTALVGESGSGKSTIMKLILGLYEPEEGNIAFYGDEAVSFKNLRSKTAYVPQDTILFRGSIYDNIACGNENAAKDEVVYAAKLAEADEFICSLENDYDTILLDDGKSLSGGQKQRIAIARALIKNAPILLLDEITSALDRKTEENILETIKNISRIKTVLFITHSDNVIKCADRIYKTE